MSNSLWSHGLQHDRLLCSPLSSVCSNSCPLSQSCYLTIAFSATSSHLPLISPKIRVFSNESALRIRQPKYWTFSYSIRPSNKYLWYISFMIDGFELHAVQEVLKSVLQHHSLKASILQCAAFFMVQLSHPYIMEKP